MLTLRFRLLVAIGLFLAGVLLSGCVGASSPPVSNKTPVVENTPVTSAPVSRPTTSASAAAPAPATERVIRHMGGETTIVGTPERVVGLAPIVYESLVALDIEPVAITLFAEGGASQPYEEFPPYLQERLQGIEMVGNRNEPSLEAILAVKPDLIIGADAHIEIYDSLSRIAPTLIFEGCSSNCSNENQSWRTTLTGIGEAFGVESRARKVIDDYESKAANAKIALQESVGGESVMLLRLLANGFRIHGPQHSTMGHILYDDLGLALPAALPDDLATEFVPMEQLLEVDPDHLFLMKGNEEREKELLEGPIWKELSAVKNNHVYEVDVYWIRGHGAFGKNAIVDDAVRLLAGD